VEVHDEEVPEAPVHRALRSGSVRRRERLRLLLRQFGQPGLRRRLHGVRRRQAAEVREQEDHRVEAVLRVELRGRDDQRQRRQPAPEHRRGSLHEPHDHGEGRVLRLQRHARVAGRGDHLPRLPRHQLRHPDP